MAPGNPNADKLGNEFGKDYSLILTDPSFERRLKAFDPSLRLMFDQNKRRWTILQQDDGGGSWNVILRAEWPNGEPKPLGEWVFNTLYVYRKRAEEKRDNFDVFWNKILNEEQRQREAIKKRISDNHRHLVMDQRSLWREAYRELNNLPISDIRAGYRKVSHEKNKSLQSNI